MPVFNSSSIIFAAPSPVPAVDFYWTFETSNKSTSLDLVHGRAAQFKDGAFVLRSPERGSVVNTVKSKYGWISLGDFEGI